MDILKAFFRHDLLLIKFLKGKIIMSFLNIKNKTEPKYTDPLFKPFNENVIEVKSKSEKKIVNNSNSLRLFAMIVSDRSQFLLWSLVILP